MYTPAGVSEARYRSVSVIPKQIDPRASAIADGGLQRPGAEDAPVNHEKGAVGVVARRREAEIVGGLHRHVSRDLNLDLGAVESDLDLTGLRISRLRVESGASDAKLRFDSLNATRMSVLDISLGAASFRGDRLANANAQDIRVDAGIGNVELDLGGHWTQDIDLHVEVTLGIVTIHVPSDVGVHVSLEKTVASFDHEGLIERDGAWVSKNWDSAPHKVRVTAKTVFGKLSIDRTGR